MSPASANTVEVTWHTTPPTPAQLRAWEALWQRLLSVARPSSPNDEHGAAEGWVRRQNDGEVLKHDDQNE